ncbi:hypothetical protein B0O99DRAFT_642934 [Bisporella sp. PMI_857]|nr:hypothetical protein B0O99DRAFT_643054 [Bisporella sp. PMI_857]KAH8587025.1 hypothetical protein B0O99DRAFT_642934 [Bisporella sp. PMI_857]
MRSAYLLALFPFTAIAALNGHCSGTATGSYLTHGICVSTSTCNSYSGSYISGGCPSDASNIRCCVIGLAGSISTNPCGGSSFCTWTTFDCSGDFEPGHCPGGSNYQCCLN